VSDDLAARDLGLVGNQRLEPLVADPRGDDVRRLLALLRRLEETERAEYAVAGLDQVVAREPGQLLQLRDEGLVDPIEPPDALRPDVTTRRGSAEPPRL